MSLSSLLRRREFPVSEISGDSRRWLRVMVIVPLATVTVAGERANAIAIALVNRPTFLEIMIPVCLQLNTPDFLLIIKLL